MKRVLYIVLFLVVYTISYAQLSLSMVSKLNLIKDVNRGKNWYAAAVQDLKFIKDWSLSPDYDAQWLSKKKENDFLLYLDSLGVDSEIQKQFSIYVEKNRRYSFCEDAYHEAEEYLLNNDFAFAIPCFLTSCDIYRELFGEKHLNYAIALQNTAASYLAIEDIVNAEKYLGRSIILFEEILDINSAEGRFQNVSGENYVHYVNAVKTMGFLLYKKNKFEEAKRLSRLATNILEILPEEDEGYIESLISLAVIHLTSEDDYDISERLLEKAIQVYNDRKVNNTPLYAEIIESLAHLHAATGNYKESKKFFLQVLQIREEAEEDPLSYANTLSALSNCYRIEEDNEQALQYSNRALQIKKDVWGENHTEYLRELKNLAVQYYDMDSIKQAQNCFFKAMELALAKYGESSDIYSSICGSYGWLLFSHLKDTVQAESYLYKTAQIKKSIYGANHDNYIRAISNLSSLYQAKGEYSKAEVGFKEQQTYYQTRHASACNYMSETERESYWKRHKYFYEKIVPTFACLYYPQKYTISKWIYDTELFVKGFLLQSSNAVKNSVLESGDSTLIRQWGGLIDLKKAIGVLQNENPNSESIQLYERQAQHLEKEVTRSSAVYRENMRQWNITWDSVRATLKPNQVAIEYMRAPMKEDSTMYCALLLRDTCSHPILISLFEEKEVSDLLQPSSDDTTLVNKTYDYRKNGKLLSVLIWENVLPYINEGESVYFAPKGILHRIAIENLPYDSIRTMTDVFNLVRLSSTRELVLRPKTHHNKTAALFGDINYYASIDELAGESARYGTFASRSLRNDTIDRGQVTYLPGTREEIENIQQTLLSSHINVVSFSKVSATEESFKALSGTHTNIIHLATHGFYWEDPTAKQEKFFAQHISGLGEVFQLNVSIDPLDRCGLLFAGANTALSGHSNRIPKNVQDGVLTAKEISNMDLRDADIVILSACETGLGDISGEGVFGLQRAFKMAGAQSILMALWKVDDEATKTLMTAFYRYYCQGNNKRQALRLAQQEVRKNGYSNPYYWAGFVLLD